MRWRPFDKPQVAAEIPLRAPSPSDTAPDPEDDLLLASPYTLPRRPSRLFKIVLTMLMVTAAVISGVLYYKDGKHRTAAGAARRRPSFSLCCQLAASISRCCCSAAPSSELSPSSLADALAHDAS